MYSLPLKTATGDITFSYVISTPTQTAVARIPEEEADIPTVVFLHPVYVGKIIYHPQFADRQLRRFNLVALDLRCHAGTVGRSGPGYGREVAARDVSAVMAALRIPKYHIFGLSMGGCVAIQTSILFPEAVLSVFVVSSLPLTEPPDIGEGRQEIFDCWKEGAKLEGSEGSSQQADYKEEGGPMRDAYTGAMQLGFNGEPTPLFNAICQRSFELLGPRWTDEQLADWKVATVDFFTLREAYTMEALSNIQCPIRLIHCGADIAYPIEMTEELATRLTRAGVKNVVVQQIPDAPHFGTITHPKEINEMFHGYVLSSCAGSGKVPPLPPPEKIVSPWLDELKGVGFEDDEDEDSGEEYT
ncbi:AB hydrolase-1 domain-containing protein [Mycena chlorophos]|uniref:AB hydrolase-1 domain-containing protein n=1 Tax=Mycena chlorophos TaxID=658473 RepID=A0A8H6TKM2_MYCCL|nr:AB hydrolase-1 domain-containing protein [Mycena chlorophos]